MGFAHVSEERGGLPHPRPNYGAMAKWKRWGLQNLDARVRFPLAPPKKYSAWVAELVYAQDLKSWARKGLRVRFPPQAP
jgi:hypothetical protein